MNIPVFVINLQRSADRRTHTVNQLNDLDVPFQIIEAVDGAKLSNQEVRNNKEYGIWKCGLRTRYLLNEEIGCVLSHMKIYRKMISEGIELACILEDDNDYNKELKDFLVFETINVVDWDLLYLGHHAGRLNKGIRSRNKKKVLNNYHIGEAIEVPFGTYAYIIRKEAAEKLLNNCFPISKPADHYTGNAPSLGIRTFVVSPPCAFNNPSFCSTIHTSEKIIYTNPFYQVFSRHLLKIYIWVPWLLQVRVWLHIHRFFPLMVLRKSGLIKNTYAKIS
jgi:glycosyl transferase, family 25